ncbi:MAG: hypothetical protein ACRD3C_19830, partial [Vicinamibacterales bacterium]
WRRRTDVRRRTPDRLLEILGRFRQTLLQVIRVHHRQNGDRCVHPHEEGSTIGGIPDTSCISKKNSAVQW